MYKYLWDHSQRIVYQAEKKPIDSGNHGSLLLSKSEFQNLGFQITFDNRMHVTGSGIKILCCIVANRTRKLKD